MTGKAVFRRSRPAGCFACLHTVDLIAPVTRLSSWAWTGNYTMEQGICQGFSCSAHPIWWSDLFSLPAEIRRHGYRSRNITESVTATFGRNRKYAESVKIYSFGAETETEIRSNIRLMPYSRVANIEWPCSYRRIARSISNKILYRSKSGDAL